jgi:hypothetical protein
MDAPPHHVQSRPYLPRPDMLPTGKFAIHAHPSLHDTTILCNPDGRAITTLNGPRVRHLFQLFHPDLSQHTFEEEVYHLLTRPCSRSESHSPTPATTTRNRWATREDLLTTLRYTFHIRTELYSDPFNKSLHSHTYHPLYPEDIVFSSSGSNAPHTWHGTNIANPECVNATTTACAAPWNTQSQAHTSQPLTHPAQPSSYSPDGNTHHTATPNTSTPHTPTTSTVLHPSQ